MGRQGYSRGCMSHPQYGYDRMNDLTWGTQVHDGRFLGLVSGFGGKFGTPAHETYRYILGGLYCS